MEQNTMSENEVVEPDELWHSFGFLFGLESKIRKVTNQIHEFRDFLQDNAESFCETQQRNAVGPIENPNQSREVLPQMFVTDFYEGETGRFSYSSSFRQSRKKQVGEPITMNQFFDKGGDGTPNHVCITGPAGSGKSTILRRFVRNEMPSIRRGDVIFIINGQNYHHLRTDSQRETTIYTRERDRKRIHAADMQFNTVKREKMTSNVPEEVHQESSDEMTLFEFMFPGYDTNNEVLNDGLESMIEYPTDITFVIDSLDTLPFSLEGTDPKITYEDKATPATFMYNIMVGNLFPGCRILSSSREYAIAGYKGKLRADRVIHLEGLTKESMKKFIGVVLKESESEKFSDTLEMKYPDLWFLCSTPMYLVFTLLVYKAKGDVEKLPTTMSGVIIEILQLLIFSDHAKSSCRDLDIPDIINKLKLLSYNGIRGEKITFEQTDLDEVHLTAEAASALTTCSPGGKKKQVVEGNSKFFFCHLSLQEALCALHVVQMPVKDFKKFVEELKKPALSVVRRFTCGILLDEALFNRATSAHLLEGELTTMRKRNDLLDDLTKQLQTRMRKLERLELYFSLQEAGEGASAIMQANHNAVDMTGMELAISHMHVIGSMVDRSRRLKKVTLSDCNLTPQLMHAMELALRDSNILIEELDMSKNWEMTEDGAEVLGNLVRKAHVKSLSLDGCGFSGLQLQRFNQSLDNFKIQTVSMTEIESKPEISDETINAICGMLGHVTDSIDLHGWELSDEEAKRLENELQKRRNEDRSFKLFITHGRDGEKKIEAESLTNVFEEVSNDLHQSFFIFARLREGLDLGLTKVEEIRENWKHDIHEQKIQLLMAWKEKLGHKATCSKLREVVETFRAYRSAPKQ